MNRFLTFLGEAFPPPKKPAAGSVPKKPSPITANPPPPGGSASKPAGGGKPPFGKKPTPAVAAGDETAAPDEESGEFGEDPERDEMGAKTDALIQMQQAQQEKEQQELLMRQTKQAEEDAERRQVKELRAKADAEVAAALEDKYNGNDDAVEFYPEILTFGQFTKDGKQDPGAPGQQSGKVGTAPGDGAPENAGSDGKMRKTAKEQDDRQDESDKTDPNPDEDDAEDVDAQREKRQKDVSGESEAKKPLATKKSQPKKLKEGAVISFQRPLFVDKHSCDNYTNMRYGWIYWKDTRVELVPNNLTVKPTSWTFPSRAEAEAKYEELYRTYADTGYQ